MRHSPRRTVEIETLAELDQRLALGTTDLSGWRLQSLDLRGHSEVLRGLDVTEALFLGCRLEPSVEHDLRERGALVFPLVPGVPVDPYRAHLYTPAELYDGLAAGEYPETLDARVYAWTRTTGSDVRALLAQSLHDLSVDDALDDLVTDATAEHALVGVMGGHAAERGSEAYRDAARLGRSLTRAGLMVATGGGPGAMEAANLGAWLTDPDAIDPALAVLSAEPSFRPDVGAWAQAAFAVRERWPGGRASLGVPTWFYGHEPPNVFATAIAKYLANATREAVLLSLCDAGTVFLPGVGGTVQEVFQDACENYYADESSVAPMVLVGRAYWTEELPVWPLLRSLARGRPMEDRVHLVDDVSEAAQLLGRPQAASGR